jgi:sporulation protein YlmC with PRC-barrel domain
MTELFASQLKGKTVMTKGGEILGTLEEMLVDTKSGRILHLLVAAADGIEPRLYKTDAKGRLELTFSTMRSVKDVVVVELEEE